MKKALRKCAICDHKKETKSIDLENNDYIKYKEKFYHIDCLITQEKNKKKNKKTEEELNFFIDELKKETELYKKEMKDKYDLHNWLYENYEVTVLSNYLFTKICEINNGTYRGLKEGISNEDLLEIFKKMKDYLNKVAYKKRFKSQLERINYDLAIVVNNYDKYKAWKRNQENLYVDEEKQTEVIEDKKIYDKLINNNIKNRNNKENNPNKKVDVISIINELF